LHDGVWEDLELTNDYAGADYWVVIDGGYSDKNVVRRRVPARTISIRWEPTLFTKIASKKVHKIKAKHCFDHHNGFLINLWWLDKTYAELASDEGLKERKTSQDILSCVCSAKTSFIGHKQRVALLYKFLENYQGKLDLYGRGHKAVPHYRGTLGKGTRLGGDKSYGLWKYTRSLALENIVAGHPSYDKDPEVLLRNWFTEKLTDCFLCMTHPIYYGVPDLSRFFPKESFHQIDFQDADVAEQILEIMNTPVSADQTDALREARNRALNVYNIWPTIKRIIDTGHMLPEGTR
jgi:hypothetical protein